MQLKVYAEKRKANNAKQKKETWTETETATEYVTETITETYTETIVTDEHGNETVISSVITETAEAGH